MVCNARATFPAVQLDPRKESPERKTPSTGYLAAGEAATHAGKMPEGLGLVQRIPEPRRDFAHRPRVPPSRPVRLPPIAYCNVHHRGRGRTIRVTIRLTVDAGPNESLCSSLACFRSLNPLRSRLKRIVPDHGPPYRPDLS